MTVVVNYENVAPDVLATLVAREVPMACCIFSDINEDCFEFSVCGWLPLTKDDIIRVKGILAPYI